MLLLAKHPFVHLDNNHNTKSVSTLIKPLGRLFVKVL